VVRKKDEDCYQREGGGGQIKSRMEKMNIYSILYVTGTLQKPIPIKPLASISGEWHDTQLLKPKILLQLPIC
jgi:hypothetical protein